MRNETFWVDTSPLLGQSRLAGDVETDVCVIGAGIAGISTAYLLTKEGRSVVVVDQGLIGSGETAKTTAHLASAIDNRYYHLEQLHGEEGARLAADSHSAAIDFIETVSARETIQCDFARLQGYLFLGPHDSVELLQRELAASHRAGLRGVRLLERAPLDYFDTGPCLEFPRQGQFHPLRYLEGLANATIRQGGRIFTQSHIRAVGGDSPIQVQTETGAIHAQRVVVATNTPMNTRVTIHTKQAAYRSYVIAASIPGKSVTQALYWDTLEPYHYVRTHRNPDESQTQRDPAEVLIVGGEDHKTGQVDDAAQRFRRLEAWARDRFPMMGKILYRWSGQIMETIDGLAYIGRSPGEDSEIYLATGDSGMGMTHGTIAGLLISDLIMGHDNPWERLYNPSRIILRAAGDFAEETLNFASQYADWITPGQVDSSTQISRGTGAILRRGLSKIAAYCDAQGKVHELSAICPHLACVVNWNSAENTWDCPCHGSRFDIEGQVLNGPAVTNLPRVTA